MPKQPSSNSVAVVLSTEQEAILQQINDKLPGGQGDVATDISAIKGQLEILGAPGDAAGVNTIIGLLKQIAINTTPSP